MIYERESHELRPSARPPLHHQLYNGDVRVSAPNVLSFTVICVRSMLQGFTFRLQLHRDGPYHHDLLQYLRYASSRASKGSYLVGVIAAASQGYPAS